MARGISLHIGLNSVDPNQYGGNALPLNACEFDAQDMESIAASQGFATKLLLTQNAHSVAVKHAIDAAAGQLQPGDIFFLTYSGHGSNIDDSDFDEADGKDETWVLYDRNLIDDELYLHWSRFRPGVRVLVVSDSCHSGTVVRAMENEESRVDEFNAIWCLPVIQKKYEAESAPLPRTVPFILQARHYVEREELYKAIKAANAPGERSIVGASVMLISACQDSQLAGDGQRNGVFTRLLRHIWNDGGFVGDYQSFYTRIRSISPMSQVPNLYKVGQPNDAFESESPFFI